jgi:aminopeptidase N
MVLIQVQPLLFRSSVRSDPGDFSDVEGFFLAHELAHQWWGHGVAAQNYHERWLSEGMAQYAAARWAHRFHGADTFRKILRRMASWARKLADKGPISLGHRLGLVENNPQVFRAIAYNKGAYVLHMLRGIVGDDAFRKALTSLQERHRFQKIGTSELKEALETASGQDLAPYFEDWVYGTSIATLKWSSRTTRDVSGYRTEVRVRAKGLPAPVPLELTVVFSRELHREKVMLQPSGGRFTLRTRERPRRIQVNEDLGLLADVDEL